MIAALNFSPLPLYLAERAELHHKHAPLVVTAEQRVLHANAPARKQGITPGMRLAGARLRVPKLTVTETQEPDVEHAWSAILSELVEFTPWVEAGARGRAFARLNAAEAGELARRYGVPVGLADDVETAELAALAARPGRVREVNGLSTHTFLDRLPLRFLKGVGLSGGNLTRLQWLGVDTAGQLARWSAPQLRAYLSGEGERLLPYLKGPRRSRLHPYQQPEALSRSLAFTEPVLEPYQLRAALERLAAQLEGALSGRSARRLTLTAATAAGQRRASRLSKLPLQQARQIGQQALFALRDSRTEGLPVERLTLELAAPTRAGSQGSLWPQRERRQLALLATLERFPTSPRRLAWRDPYSQAADLAWKWERYAQGEAAGVAAATAEGARPNSRAANAAQAAASAAAVATAAVPLFDPASLTGYEPPSAPHASPASAKSAASEQRERDPGGAILFGGLP